MIWLTDKQLEAYTRRKRPSAQAQVLREAGIPFRIVDGRPMVMVSDLSPTHRKPEGKLVLA